MSGRQSRGPPSGRGQSSGRGQPSGRGDGGNRGRGAPYDGGGRGAPGGRGDRGGRGGGRGGIFRPAEDLKAPSPEVQKAEDQLMANKGSSLAGLSLSGNKLPLRPAYATKGTAIILRTNYFQILPKPDLQLFRYQVDPPTELKAARKRKRAFQLLIEKAPFLAGVRPAVATDNRSMLITTKKLNLGPQDREVALVDYYEAEEGGPNQERPTVYSFGVSYTKTYSVQELMDYLSSTDPSSRCEKDDVIQALNVAMARKPSTLPNVASSPGLNKFFPLEDQRDLTGGLVALRGYYSSVRTSTLRLLLNVNSVTGTFYKPGPLVDVVMEFAKTCPGNPAAGLNHFLKGVRVEVTHLKTKTGQNRTKVIAGLARPPASPFGAGANTAKFFWDEIDREITVKEYFNRQYNKNIVRDNMPVVNVGNGQHPVFIPPELCIVLPGQMAKKKLSPAQTQEMIRVACRPPADNAELIVGQGARTLGLAGNSTEGPSLFGLSITAKMLTVPGRILMAPQVKYKAGAKSIADASWNLAGIKFVKPATISRWATVDIRYSQTPNDNNRMDQLRQDFPVFLRATGLNVEPAINAPGLGSVLLNPQQPTTHEAAIERLFINIRKQTKIHMLLIVLPVKSQALYATVKYLGDVKYGLHTVCCVGSTIAAQKKPEQYFANVSMKWNLKKGGINHMIPPTNLGILSSKTMLVGIDVTHPSPESQKGAPSVAGVVASVDNNDAQWPASVRCQEGRKEMVVELEDMILQRLKLWQKHNPKETLENIIVYRDGVSEGQYKTVLDQESPAFDKALAKVFGAKKRPKVSIIIVGKRHHTRFYPTTADNTDRVGNPKNGTVVDRGVTSERHWDFFLQAHVGLQGTARPAHYIVVQDQIGLGADNLEQMTHNLCYLFGRATKAVSICPPAYYADLLCERARMYLYETFNRDAVSVSGSESEFNWQQGARWTSGVHADLQDTMFYI